MDKTCIICNEVKPHSEFHKKSVAADGHDGRCKPCKAILAKTKYKNMEKAREAAKRYYHRHKEKVRKYCKIWWLENPGYKKKYYRKNRERILVQAKERAMIDPKYRLNKNMRKLIYYYLKEAKNGQKWQSLVGWTIDELMQHLESQFVDGMTWDNYGEWHVDHKTPSTVFNFKKPTDIDFQRCWALENLQPLWAKDNMSKNDKLNKPFQPSLAIAVMGMG